MINTDLIRAVKIGGQVVTIIFAIFGVVFTSILFFGLAGCAALVAYGLIRYLQGKNTLTDKKTKI